MSFKVLGIGELLWDLLPDGRQMGGATANFAYHTRALGANAMLISRVGNDDLGRDLLVRLKELGMPSEGVEIDPSSPTGTVTVEVDRDGQPRYTIHEDVAWDKLSGEAAAKRAVSEADAVCFGTLARRREPSCSTIRSLLRMAPAGSLRVLDLNLRQHYYSKALIEESLELANVLKVNETELVSLAEMFSLAGDQRAQLLELAERHELRIIACTRGERGSILLANAQWSEHCGFQVKVADTVGAGDAFTAGMTLGALAGWELDRINGCANELAAYVASCAGGTPALPGRLRELFRGGG